MRAVIVTPRPPDEGPPRGERPPPHPPRPHPPRPHPPRPHPPRPRPPRPRPPAPPAGTGCPPGFFRNEAALATVPLAPATPVAIDRRWPQSRRAIAGTYNRIGGLIDALARRLGVDTEAALAVWFVESAGRTHTPGRAIIRFENHLFFGAWGRTNARVFDQHFRFGGRGGQPGRSFEGHQMRDAVTGPFRAVHTGSQDDEYAALALAQRLGADAGVASISIGGPQILTSNFAMLGYPSARAMHDAFQADERAQVIGFFDFICRSRLQPAMRQHRWEDFARVYNGPANTVVYGGRLRAAHGQASALGLGGRRP
jgi:hypothetical protein